MDTPITFTVRTTREGQPPRGSDSMIADAPADLYTSVDGKPALVMGRLSAVLREMSEYGAAGVGEQLHHAEWIVTADPEQVRERGMVHDCASCRASLDQALAFLREHPGRELLVGVLYWA